MSNARMLHFKVTLKEVGNPVVWRRVSVPSDFTFEMFHRVLQIAFGWSDYHLYEFTDAADCRDSRQFRIAIPSEYDCEYQEKTYDARRKRLSSVFPKHKSLSYIYDFGDHWDFEIELERTSKSDDRPMAVCRDGGGATPPEDCGGPGGYEMMKISLAKEGEQSEMYLRWLGMQPGDKWDAEFFPRQLLRYINIALAYLS